jgi:hypothetical protein
MFVFVELKEAEQPVLDLRLLGNLSMACIGGTSFLSSAATVCASRITCIRRHC